MQVKDIMNGTILHADKEERLDEIIRLLYEYNADAIIIRNEGIPEGIITTKEIIKGFALHKKNPSEIKAKEVMTTPIPSIDHDTDTASAKEIMQKMKVNNIPVKMELDIVGLLTTADLMQL